MAPNIVLFDIDNTLSNMDHKPCKLCTTNLDSHGYGRIRVDGKRYLAHRVAYCIANNLDIKEISEWDVLHTCDTPACIEPSHLYLGTDKENGADKVARGRTASKERNGRSMLTEHDVKEIRNRISCGETQTAIAQLFGVSRSAVAHIQSGKNWGSL